MVDYDSLWKVGNQLCPITDHEVLEKVFKICGERMKVYVMPKVEIGGEEAYENDVHGKNRKEGIHFWKMTQRHNLLHNWMIECYMCQMMTRVLIHNLVN